MKSCDAFRNAVNALCISDFQWRDNRACKACSARGPSAVGWGQNLPYAVFLNVMLALYITINLEIRSLDYENRNYSASNEQFQSAHSSLLLTENVLTCWINDFVGVPKDLCKPRSAAYIDLWVCMKRKLFRLTSY